MTIHNKITPDEQRILTKLVNLQRENLHRNCSVEIQKNGPHHGLYCVNKKCKKTGAWINWIKQDQVDYLLRTTK